MNAELLHVGKEKVIKTTVVACASLVASSAVLVFAGREISKIRTEKKLEAVEQAAGDGNYIITPEEVMQRLQ